VQPRVTAVAAAVVTVAGVPDSATPYEGSAHFGVFRAKAMVFQPGGDFLDATHFSTYRHHSPLTQ
jgi:hypothetical protein